jgi:hypothetical protein
MTTYEIAWGVDDAQPTGQPVRLVNSGAELDAVFNEIAASGPHMVTVYPADGDPDGPSLQVGIGHPRRGFALWLGPDGGYGFDPALDPLDEELTFDYGGEPTDYGSYRTRLTAEQARHVAHEFVTTGERPRSVAWEVSDRAMGQQTNGRP